MSHSEEPPVDRQGLAEKPGDLAGKTVALEPSTGFSFDTPMTVRMR